MSVRLCRLIFITLATIGFTAAPLSASAQTTFPNKLVRIIVPFSPGGASDALPRLIATPLSSMWGQSVIVENRPGAAGNIGMELGAKAAPDGYTLTSAPVGNLALNPHLYSKLSFDVLKDYTPITLVGSVQNVLVIHPSVPAKSVKELIALLKARPGELTYASGGVGTQAHMAGELFKAMTGTDMLHVPYKASTAAVTDLMSGGVQVLLANAPVVAPHLEAGRIRALGISSPQRSPFYPSMPAIAESVPGFEVLSWGGIVGPAHLSPEIVARLNAEIRKALATPAVLERFKALGAEAAPSTPEEFRQFSRQETEKWAKVIKISGATVD
jgi:tripartite-type tricarboxylate transporter receptor subunit TctC